MIDADSGHIRQILLNLVTNPWEEIEERDCYVTPKTFSYSFNSTL